MTLRENPRDTARSLCFSREVPRVPAGNLGGTRETPRWNPKTPRGSPSDSMRSLRFPQEFPRVTSSSRGHPGGTRDTPCRRNPNFPPPGSVKTRRAPSRHCRNARVYGHTTTAMYDNEYTLPPGSPRGTMGSLTYASDIPRGHKNPWIPRKVSWVPLCFHLEYHGIPKEPERLPAGTRRTSLGSHEVSWVSREVPRVPSFPVPGISAF